MGSTPYPAQKDLANNARSFSLGLTRRRNKYIPLGKRWKRAWGKRNE